MNPLDYSLCCQTVTIYRRSDQKVSRQVAENCCLTREDHTPTEVYGKSRSKKFLLIIPGDFPLQPGDRIYDGIGPETVDWQTFLPAAIPELYQVSFAKPRCWEGEIAHWEAGHR